VASSGPVSPAVQLRRYLTEARAMCLPFSEAWPWALRKVKWPHDTEHRREWKAILGDGKEVETPRDTLRAWGSAYRREQASEKDRHLSTLIAA
jgi:hypothetical protein